jgi:catalase
MRLPSHLGMTLGASLLALTVIPSALAADPPLPFAIVDQFNTMFGVHPGFRANHAKGIVLHGTFTATPEAKTFSKAAHLQGATVPVTVRFSNAGGLPDAPDTHPSMLTRGMAIKFALPDGSITDIVSISTNGFPVSNGEDFLALLRALAATKPDSPHPSPIEAFAGAHPAAAKAFSTPQPIPVSYGTLPFFGVNAFKFTSADGTVHFGRYRIIPEAGEHYVPEADVAKLAPNFLADDMRARLKTGPVKFKLTVQVADAADVTNDATVAWPESRPIITLGELTINSADPDSLAAEKKLLFVPTNLTPGIEASADPLLGIRTAAYGVSYGRRSKAN